MLCRRRNFTMINLMLLLLLVVPWLAASVEPPQATHLYSFSEGLSSPIRIAIDAEGNAYVTDTREHRVSVLDAYGNLLRYIHGQRSPLGIAVGSQGRLYVGCEDAGSVTVFTPEGTATGKLGTGNGQFTMPADIAIDSQNRIYVVDSKENCVKVFNENGDFRFQFGDTKLTFPTGIAIDETNNAVLVGQYGGIENGARAAKVQVFDMQGQWKNSIGRYGTSDGEFIRIQGIAIDKLGRIYVTDCFRSNIQVFDYTGNLLSSIGHYGTEPGEFRLPSDAAFDPYNRLWVTSSDNGSVEVFGIDEYGIDQTPVVNSFAINLAAGINFISVPLKPVEAEWRVSDLAAHIGDDVISIISYISEQEGASCYMPSFHEDDPSNVPVKGSDSYIVIMWKGKTVTFEGTAWDGEVLLPAGMSMFAMPLEPTHQWQLGDLADHIGGKVTHLITFARSTSAFETYTPSIDPPPGVSVEGGMGCIAVMSESKVVVFEGKAWKNEGPIAAAPGDYDVTPSSSASVLVVQGKVLDPEGRADFLSASQGISIQIKNQSTGVERTVKTNPNGDYVATFVDFIDHQTARVGDAISVKVTDPQWTVQTVPHELDTEDIRMGHVAFSTIQLEVMPKKSVLLHNYPNPANPETWIPYRLSEDADVRIEVYNVSGRLVRTLSLGKKEAGNYVKRQRAAYWDGRNGVGEAVASGIYFYVIRAGAFGATGRMVILK